MAVVRINAYDEVLEFLVSKPTLEQIIAFRPSDETDGRIHDLLENNRTGRLTDAEQAELDEFDQIEHLMRRLKAYAQRKRQQA